MGNNIRGAIFDMDGLLIDTEKLYLKYWKQAAAEYGYTMLDEHVFAIRSLARKYSIPKLKGIFGDEFPTEDIRKRRTELINEDIEKNGIQVKKGMRELLSFLKENNIRTAVATATNRERTTLYLRKINAENLFDSIICVTWSRTESLSPISTSQPQNALNSLQICALPLRIPPTV